MWGMSWARRTRQAGAWPWWPQPADCGASRLWTNGESGAPRTRRLQGIETGGFAMHSESRRAILEGLGGCLARGGGGQDMRVPTLCAQQFRMLRACGGRAAQLGLAGSRSQAEGPLEQRARRRRFARLQICSFTRWARDGSSRETRAKRLAIFSKPMGRDCEEKNRPWRHAWLYGKPISSSRRLGGQGKPSKPGLRASRLGAVEGPNGGARRGLDLGRRFRD